MTEQKIVIVDMAHHGAADAIVDSKKSTEMLNKAIAELNQEGFRVSQIAPISGADEFSLGKDLPILHFTTGIVLLAEKE